MKRRILEVDLSRKKSSPLTDLEREARERARGVVERADLLRMEQEEEMRALRTVSSGGEGCVSACAEVLLKRAGGSCR